MKNAFIEAVLKGATRGWKIFSKDEPDGEEREIAPALLRILNPAFGELRVGRTLGGWDGWAFHENGGGGSVVVPFVRLQVSGKPEPELLVGVVRQPRPNQGAEPVDNLPRGFTGHQTHFQAAAREGEDELQLPLESAELFELDGRAGNPNSTFFVTNGKLPSGEDEGVRFFGLRLAAHLLNPVVRDDGSRVFLPGVIRPRRERRREDFQTDAQFKAYVAERKFEEVITGSRFISPFEAQGLGDLFTVSGTARLQRHLALFGPSAKPLAA